MPAGQTVLNGLPFLQCRSDIHIKNLWTRIYISHKSIGSPGELYNLKTCQSPFQCVSVDLCSNSQHKNHQCCQCKIREIIF